MTFIQALPYIMSISILTVGTLHVIIIISDVQDPAELPILRKKKGK